MLTKKLRLALSICRNGSGAFVDIGGIDGMVHISEMSWSRIKHPLDVVSVGDILRVKVISVDEKRGRIGLSLKDVPQEEPRKEARA